jgi:hypothetical protein
MNFGIVQRIESGAQTAALSNEAVSKKWMETSVETLFNQQTTTVLTGVTCTLKQNVLPCNLLL